MVPQSVLSKTKCNYNDDNIRIQYTCLSTAVFADSLLVGVYSVASIT